MNKDDDMDETPVPHKRRSYAKLLVDNTPCTDYRNRFKQANKSISKDTSHPIVSAVSQSSSTNSGGHILRVPLQSSLLEEKFLNGNRPQSRMPHNPVEFFFENVDNAVCGFIKDEDSDSTSEEEIISVQSTVEEEKKDEESCSNVLFADYIPSESNEEDDDYKPPYKTKYMGSDNHIQDSKALKSTIKDNLECPCCRAQETASIHTKGRKHNPRSCLRLEVTIETFRFATEVII